MRQKLRVAVDRFAVRILIALAAWAIAPAATAWAAGWTVTITAHKIEALTNSDNWGEQDIYWRVFMSAKIGSGTPVDCDTYEDHPDDDNVIEPEWSCVLNISGGPDALAEIAVQVYDEDTIGDDELDISLDHSQLGVLMTFEPRTSKLAFVGTSPWPANSCAMGRIKTSGFGGGGDEPADLIFSVSASPGSAIDGDSDNDGLLDSWEVCGLDGNGDNIADVDLPGMGADPFRKDVFLEIDWMVDRTSGAPHSHAPWLPALVNAWNEFDRAPVTNPPFGGAASKSGIALHVDVGTLYAGYTLDMQGDGVNEYAIGASGNFDVDGDGTIDIGNLGSLGTGTTIGGAELPEDACLGPTSAAVCPPATPVANAGLMFGPGSEFAAIRAAGFAAARDPAFHYVVFGHSYTQVAGGPANSSGLAEPCAPKTPCNELMVTLGGLTRQTIDANRDDAPDPAPAAVVLGPGGFQVDGLVGDHVGTLMHELGHNLSLAHGGLDGINFKPNFLSIMNYAFQLPGLSSDLTNDGLADPLGIDFDGDGAVDTTRYQYSSFFGAPAIPTLNEGRPAPPAPPAINETTAVAPWSLAMSTYSCPALVAPPGPPNPVVLPFRLNQTVDWNCTPGPTVPPRDINNAQFNSGVTEVLTTTDEYDILANGGLDVGGGIGKDDYRALQAATRRIIEPAEREGPALQCAEQRRIDFEDFAPGTNAETVYAPLVTFLADEVRAPVIIGPGDRNNVPTQSPAQSLLNHSRGAIAPLVIEFSQSQRFVRLRFGQAALANAEHDRVRAAFEAFDQYDVSMGTITKALPSPSAGITAPVTLAAVYPSELITRLEIRYEVGSAGEPILKPYPIAEPVQIDDLEFCARLDDSEVEPPLIPELRFGDLSVSLKVAAEALVETAGSGEPGNKGTLRVPFTGLPVAVDGTPMTTDLTLTRTEGNTVTLSAPASAAVGPFLYWRYGDALSLGNGVRDVTIAMLKKGVLTAVYKGREYPPERDRRQPQRPEGSSSTERAR